MDWQRIVELRQYTLVPGSRERLIQLFETHLVAGQQRHPMRVVGQFRDLDRPDRFVWFRDFPDMTARHQALSDFYTGPVWREHRDAANSTMVDSDDVLLMHPLRSNVSPGVRSHRGGPGVLSVTLFSFNEPAVAVAADLIIEQVDPLLTESGLPSIALLETERAPNSFPQLPVHEDRHVIARVARLERQVAESSRVRKHLSRLWEDGAGSQLREALTEPPMELRLEPTSRSGLR